MSKRDEAFVHTDNAIVFLLNNSIYDSLDKFKALPKDSLQRLPHFSRAWEGYECLFNLDSSSASGIFQDMYAASPELAMSNWTNSGIKHDIYWHNWDFFKSLDIPEPSVY